MTDPVTYADQARVRIEAFLSARGVAIRWVRRSQYADLAFPHGHCWMAQLLSVRSRRTLLFHPEHYLIDRSALLAVLPEGNQYFFPQPFYPENVFPDTETSGHEVSVWLPHWPEEQGCRIWYLRTSIPGYCLQLGQGDFAKLFPHATIQSFFTPYAVCAAEIAAQDDRTVFAASPAGLDSLVQFTDFFPERIRTRMQKLHALPAFPGVAKQILDIKMNPDAGVRQLAAVIARDPALAAQVMAWSSSPYYGFSGRLLSLEEAIIKVMGFDRVLNMALAVVLGQAFQVEKEGPLGLKAYWRSALYTALCAEALYFKLHNKHQFSQGIIYLSGLLHNFGYLVLGHMAPGLFQELNYVVAFNPHAPVEFLDKWVLGVSHTQIGYWLLSRWGLAEPVLCTVRDHHGILPASSGAFAGSARPFEVPSGLEGEGYAYLIALSGRILAPLGIGDGSWCPIDEAAWQTIGLPVGTEHTIGQLLQEKRADIDAMIAGLL